MALQPALLISTLLSIFPLPVFCFILLFSIFRISLTVLCHKNSSSCMRVAVRYICAKNNSQTKFSPFFSFGKTAPPPPQWARASSFTRFLDHIQRRTTVGRIPLGEGSARRINLYLTTHNTHKKHIHALGGIRTHNLSRRATAELRVRPRGQWDGY